MITNILLGVVGPWQIILIVVVVVLLFGGKKIPELMKGIGKGVREFKEGLNPENKSNREKDSTDNKE